MYAIVVHVKIDASRRDEAERLLHEEVVPSVKQAPGLVSAYWLRSEDGTDGYSVIVFEDKDAAQKAVDLNPPQPPADAPVQLASVEIHEVLATA
jgi:quinol monooxygenase YgiN